MSAPDSVAHSQTDLSEELSGRLREGEEHHYPNSGLFDVLQDLSDGGYGVPVDRDEPLICHADAPFRRQGGELPLTLPPVLVFAGHHRHPVPLELLQQVHQGLHLPLISGHGAHEGRVQLLVTELVTGGTEADLIKRNGTRMTVLELQFPTVYLTLNGNSKES